MHRIARTIPVLILIIVISACSRNLVSVGAPDEWSSQHDERMVDQDADEAAAPDEQYLDEEIITEEDGLDEYEVEEDLADEELEHDSDDESDSEADDEENDVEIIDEQDEDTSFTDEEEEEDVEDQEEDVIYNPMGLQTWSDEDEFVEALVGGRLVIAIVTAPWCGRGNEIIEQASKAAALIDEFFTIDSGDSINSLFSNTSLIPSVQLSKPLIGVMDSETVPTELIKSLGGETYVPALKCVLTFPHTDEDLFNEEETASQETDAKDDIVMWDYIYRIESANDIYESVLMYWYRFVLSNALEAHRHDASRSPVFSFQSMNQLEDFLQIHGERLLRPAHATPRHQSKNTLMSEVFDFYMGGKHRDISGVLHNLESSYSEHNQQCTNSNEECHQKSETTQEIDPYILLVQCRSTKVDKNPPMDDEMKIFNELAEEATHRKDVAFFSLLDEPICDQWLAQTETSKNGAVGVFRARRFITYSTIYRRVNDEINGSEHKLTRVVDRITTNWRDALQNPHAVYFPSPETQSNLKTDGRRIKMNIADDPMEASEYVRSRMVPFVITQTTPTVLWFDRHRTAQLAFPWYRKLHAVLVVDIGLSHQQTKTSSTNPSETERLYGVHDIEQPLWPSKLNRSLAAAQLLSDQQEAIQLFYNAALSHRVKYPHEDVVFLIVPSSETRILTKFGIDIWTPLDEALFPAEAGKKDDESEQSAYCSSGMSNRGVLPMMFLTDDSTRSGKQLDRYYLCSDDLFAPSSTSPNNGGSIAKFLDSFFDGTIDKPFIRSETSQHSNVYNSPWQSNKNQANVTVLTGNSFESLVMDRKESHSMLLFQTITCGHCKRFSILWNEFSTLVQSLNWGDVIEVMKIDVSKNDVPHDKIDVWDVPSVYYFPANEKENPIEVTWVGPKINPQHDYDESLSWITSGSDLVEWVIRQGKLDIELLVRLDESKNKPS